MKAVRVERPGGREALISTDVPDPTRRGRMVGTWEKGSE
jgi:hypothetical protein